MSSPPATVANVGKTRTLMACSKCGQQLAQWAGRCPGCGSWGTIEQGSTTSGASGAEIRTLASSVDARQRELTGLAGIDRVLGGGLMSASVVLLAGEPGIGKSTLLLQLATSLSGAGLPCLLACGEESAEQVAARAKRLGLAADAISFVPGRELETVLAAATATQPFLLALDSIQSVRDSSAGTAAGGPSQVRACADALVGLAKSDGISVVMTGHVTKEGDVAGPRTLEHAVDVLLTFEGDPRS